MVQLSMDVPPRSLVAPALILTFLIGCAPRCYLKSDEQVNFYPGYAYPGENGALNVVLRGRVVRPSSHNAFSDSALKTLNSLTLLLPDISQPVRLLQDRLQPFAVEGRGDKAV